MSSGTGPHLPGPLEVLAGFGFSAFRVPASSGTGVFRSRCDLLCSAVEFDHLGTLEWLLEQGIDVEGRRLPQHRGFEWDDEVSALLLAAELQHPKSVKMLLKHGARPDVHDDDGTPLIYSAIHDDFESAGALIAAGADINLYFKEWTYTPGEADDDNHDHEMVALQYAAAAGSTSVLRLLLAQPSTNRACGAGSRHGTALILAARKRRAAAVDALIEVDANTSLTDSRGRTALWTAARYGHHETVRNLARRDLANLRITNDLGRPPICVAAQYGHSSVVDVLTRCVFHTRTDDVDLLGATALWIAARNGDVDVVRLFLKCNAKTTPNLDLVTPLAAAVLHGHLSVVKLLLSHNYRDMEAKSLTGRDAIDEAILFDIEGENIDGVSRDDIQTKMMAMMQEALDARMSQLNIEAAEDNAEESEVEDGEENEKRDGEEFEEEEGVWDVVWRYIF